MSLDSEYQLNTRRISRTLWALIGVSLFFWIGYEDRSTFIPVSLGGLIAAALSLYLGRHISTERFSWLREGIVTVLVGLVAGTLAMPLAGLAILVKISLHSHVPPDFSWAQVLAVLGRTPIWAGAGALAGSSLALWREKRLD